ncbi:MAG: hypothetical protein ACUVS3_11700 [Thermodesulfobacteriota bacterium]
MTEVVRAQVRSGPDNIGVCAPLEASFQRPMSFALSEKGEMYTVDQMKDRGQVFKEEKRIRTSSIPDNTYFIDVDVTRDGKIALLDNVVKNSVYILDSEGMTLNAIPLEGISIPYTPAVTEIMCAKRGELSGIWVDDADR